MSIAAEALAKLEARIGKLNLGDFFHLLDDKEFIDKMVEKLSSQEEEQDEQTDTGRINCGGGIDDEAI